MDVLASTLTVNGSVLIGIRAGVGSHGDKSPVLIYEALRAGAGQVEDLCILARGFHPRAMPRRGFIPLNRILFGCMAGGLRDFSVSMGICGGGVRAGIKSPRSFTKPCGLNLLQFFSSSSVCVMLFLVVNIANNCGKIPLAKRQHTILVLPVKLKIGFNNMIHEM
jgi:hypothetical protein